MIAETTSSLKYKVKVDDIDIDQLMHYHLMITISAKEFTIGVIDSTSNRCLLGEKHILETKNGSENLIGIFKSIVEDHHLLKARFWKKITISYSGPNFTLIPSSLVEEDNLSQYLELHGDIDLNKESIKSYNHKSLGARNIFSIPTNILEYFQEVYGDKVNFVHQTSSFIEGILLEQNTASEKSIYANCEDGVITIAVLKSGNLEYCNHFKYMDSKDIVYYTLFVMNELYLNPESTPLTIWGELDIKSDAYLQLFKYIRDIKFGSRPSSMVFSYNFDEIDEHQMFNTLSTYFCE